MDCKCGHTSLCHQEGKGECAVEGCECKKFQPVLKSNYPVFDEKSDEVYKP